MGYGLKTVPAAVCGLVMLALVAVMPAGAAETGTPVVGDLPAAQPAATPALAETANGGDDAMARGYTEQLAKIQADYQARLQVIKDKMYAEYDAQLKQAMKAIDVDLAVSMKAKREALKGDGTPADGKDAISVKYRPQLQELEARLSSAKAAAHKAALAGYSAAIVVAMKQEDLEKAVELKRRQDIMKELAPSNGAHASLLAAATPQPGAVDVSDESSKLAAEKWVLSKTKKNVQMQKFRGKSILTAVTDVMDGKKGALCWTVFKRPYQTKMGFGKRRAPEANQGNGGTFNDPWDVLGTLSSPIKYEPNDPDYCQRVQDAVNKVEVFWLIGGEELADNKTMLMDLYWVGECVCDAADNRRVTVNQYAVSLNAARDAVLANKSRPSPEAAPDAAPTSPGAAPVAVPPTPPAAAAGE